MRDKKRKMMSRRIRWEENRRAQMSVTNNVFLGIGIAILGYFVDKIIGNNITVTDYFLFALLFILISIISGVLLTVNRLLDFRYTAKTVMLEEKAEKSKDEIYKTSCLNKVNCLKCLTYVLGKISWCFLWIQILSLIIGVIMLYFYIIPNSL